MKLIHKNNDQAKNFDQQIDWLIAYLKECQQKFYQFQSKEWDEGFITALEELRKLKTIKKIQHEQE